MPLVCVGLIFVLGASVLLLLVANYGLRDEIGLLNELVVVDENEIHRLKLLLIEADRKNPSGNLLEQLNNTQI